MATPDGQRASEQGKKNKYDKIKILEYGKLLANESGLLVFVPKLKK